MTFTFKAHEKGLVHGQLFKIPLGLVTHQKSLCELSQYMQRKVAIVLQVVMRKSGTDFLVHTCTL